MRSIGKPLALVVLVGMLLVGAAALWPHFGTHPALAAQRAAPAPPTKFVVKFAPLDLPTSLGTVGALAGDVYDPSDTTRKVGEGAGTCGVAKIVVATATLMCHAILHIDGVGDLYLAGLWTIQTTYPYTFPVVISGGTDEYLADLGEADVTVDDVGTITVTLHLVPPAPTPSPSAGA